VDLVFAQCVFLWLRDARAAATEVARVLRPGGVLAAIEPDYGGIIETPDELAVGDIWQTALRRAGANPMVGRELPGWFSDAGFRVTTRLLDQVRPPSTARFDMLRELALTDEERSRVDKAEAASARAGQRAVVHLPFFLVTAELA
jgi:SAM-dependent methyltransferase